MTFAAILLAASVEIAVKTGLAPGHDPLVTHPIPELKGPVRVLDSKGRETPCAVRTDPSGTRYVAFRAVGAEMLEILDYRIVEGRPGCPELSGVRDILPGMNLFANADFSQRDENGDLLGWSPSGGYGAKKPWTEKIRERIRVKNGILGVRDAGLVTYVTGLETGHVYRLSFDARSEAKMLYTSLWFRGTNGTVANDWIRGVSNYKNENTLSGTNDWQHVESSSFVYYNEKSKRLIYNNRRLLPGTGSAYFEVYMTKGRGAVRNLRLEDVTLDTGVKAVRKTRGRIIREGR